MEKAADLLLGNPVLLLIAVIAAVMVLFSCLRNMFRLALFAAALFVLYIAYLSLTGGDAPAAVREIQETIAASFSHVSTMIKSFFDLLKSR
ncbi:hypothetical protein [Chlorobium phaeobacteroides]|uniref:Uncharacterized protein n=1 Tax=Chlorobium phaeobacteroides (strain DSM 266 / SMG 266 / 2430) TaxID=290317 RepID=A1BDJ3_CHLPD|nr:hypothetical protein [Chlorobium phaeobacteroides]ABL64470.1 hypothetical protein Cpha266_0412 [Chlorobium phaeobacteroides DSM 266]